ncbi:MAG: ATP-dependent helicase [Armatimonadota bacterium]
MKMLSLDPAQHKAAHDTDGPVLIYAGAGAGKTRVIAARVAILLDKGVSPDEILCITFTNKAAEEMKQRISQCTDRDVSGIWIGTFHAICARLLHKYCGGAFAIYDSSDSFATIKRVLNDQYIDLGEHPPGELLREISCYKRSILSDEFLKDLKSRHTSRWVEIFDNAFSGYQEELEKNNALDFDDLLMKTILMLKESALDSISGRFRYVLVDEYHDTAEIESVLVNLLTTRHGNLCVVADPKQSIYRFRGSDHRIAARFPQDHKGTISHILDTNYRSARQIVSASERVIQGGAERMPYMTTANRREDGIVSVSHYKSDTEEFAVLAQETQRLHNTGMAYSSMAVLCRTNDLAQSVGNAMAEHQIPYQRINDSGFFARREIKCIVSYLRLVVNPKDDYAAEYILKTIGHRIGSRTIDVLRADGILAACESSGKPIGITASAWSTMQEFNCAVIHITIMADLGRPLWEIIEYLIRETPLKAMAAQSMDDLKILSTRHTGPANEALPGFLEKISLADTSGMTESTQDKVRVMTIHQSKGLEFPVVFMPGVEEGLLPHIRSSYGAPLEEERRLCYVGMSRAVDRLHMSCATMRHMYGVSRQTEPSRFLKALDMR